MEQGISSSLKEEPDLSPNNSLHTITIANSSILVHIDTTTFAGTVTDSKPKIGFECIDEPINSILYKKRKCVMGCIDYKMLHRCPLDEASMEEWRKRLKLKILRKSHRICNRHFRNYGVNRKRLPGWAVPDSPEISDSEENHTTTTCGSNQKTNFFENIPLIRVKPASVLLQNENQTD